MESANLKSAYSTPRKKKWILEGENEALHFLFVDSLRGGAGFYL